MKTDYKSIFKTIEDKLIIDPQIGSIADDFISGMSTMLVTAKLPNSQFKSNSYLKVSDQILDEQTLVEDLFDTMRLESSKPIWRLNTKRIKHNLESWF